MSSLKIPALLGCVLIAFSCLQGCGGGDGGHREIVSGPVSRDVRDAIGQLTSPDSDAGAQGEALADCVKAGDYRVAAFLRSFREGQSIYRWKDRLVLVETFDEDDDGNRTARLFDHIQRTELVVDGKQVVTPKADLKEVSASRQLRKKVLAAEDSLKLVSPDETT